MADEHDPLIPDDVDDLDDPEAGDIDDGAMVDAPDAMPEPTDEPAAPSIDAAPAPAPAPAPVAEPAPSPVAPAVSTARFPPILEEAPGEAGEGRNLDLLMDVAVPITAEIGRTELPLAEVLRLGTGSVVELDKSADEPVDILVNGKLLATGEVVVVGDRFGVRILDVVDRPD